MTESDFGKSQIPDGGLPLIEFDSEGNPHWDLKKILPSEEYDRFMSDVDSGMNVHQLAEKYPEWAEKTSRPAGVPGGHHIPW